MIRFILLIPFVLLRLLQIIVFLVLYIIANTIMFLLFYNKRARQKLNKDIIFIGLDTKLFNN